MDHYLGDALPEPPPNAEVLGLGPDPAAAQSLPKTEALEVNCNSPGAQPSELANKLKTIRVSLDEAAFWGVSCAMLVKLGGYLQLLAYVWATAVILSGLVQYINDFDFWMTWGLVLMGSLMTVVVTLESFVYNLGASGYNRDTYSGHSLPLHFENLDVQLPRWTGVRPLLITWFLLFWVWVIGTAAFSVWRIVVTAGYPISCDPVDLATALQPLGGSVCAESRTQASLLIFYVMLMSSCLVTVLGRVLAYLYRGFLVYGSKLTTRRSTSRFGRELLVDIQESLLAVCQRNGVSVAPTAETGLRRVMLAFHFDHAHNISVVSGYRKGLLHATPVGFLLHEYYNGRKTTLEHAEDDLCTDYAYLLWAFYFNGSKFEKMLIDRWAQGHCDESMLLVRQQDRPGFRSLSETQVPGDPYNYHDYYP